MRKEQYKQYIDPAEFEALYNEWVAKGKPKGNDKTFAKVWYGVVQSVKACIGALQARYHCKYQDYEDKVMDATMLIMNKLYKMEDSPKNIVNMSYLPTLGVCCGPKALQKEFEENMLSLDAQTDDGDYFIDIINPDLNY